MTVWYCEKTRKFCHSCLDNYPHASATKYTSFVNQPLGQVPRESVESLPVDKALACSDPTADPAVGGLLDWSAPEVSSKLGYSV